MKIKMKFMKVEDIELTYVDIKFKHNKTNTFLHYSMGYEYKGEKHNYNFLTVKRNDNLYDLQHLKQYICDNVQEINGKFTTGLSSIDEKIWEGRI